MALTSTALALVVGLTILNPTAGATVSTGPAWCPEVSGHRVTCGTVTRPLVQGKPELGSIKVAYALVKRRGHDQPSRGTVLVNPGGPGGAPIAITGLYARGLAASLSDHDLLVVDPRGTGRSTPLACGVSVEDAMTKPRAEVMRMVGRCGERLGPRAAGYTSAATADDFDAVRAKLGISKLVLFGQSYGTYLMPIYAQRHPERVQSIVLSGAYPIDFDSLGRPSAQAVSLSLRRICERSGECDGEQAVRNLAEVAARLRTAPLDVPVAAGGKRRTYRFTEQQLAALAYMEASGGVGAEPKKAPLLGRLPRALHRAAGGDDRDLITLVRNTEEGTGGREAGYGPADLGQTIAVICNDYPRTWSVNASPAARARAFDRAVGRARAGEFGAFGADAFATAQADGGDLCLHWPAKGTARPYVSTGRFPDVPVLVLSGDLDANTPDANGRKAAAQFRRATFLSVPNTGHLPEDEPSGCVLGLVNGFIRDERVGDTSCLASVPPVKVLPVK
ncbi:alpha/beta fold hydrolase [Planomonospora algeriensis]